MRRTLITLALVTAPLAAASAQEEARAGQAVTLSGSTIDIYDLSGHVTMRRGTGSGVTVTPTAQGSDAAQLHFFVDRSSSRTVFRVQYPEDVDEIAAPEGDFGRTTVRLRADGTFGGDTNDSFTRRGRGREIDVGGRQGLQAWADLEIAVPRGASVRVHLAVGRATIDGVDGAVMIDTWSATASATNIAGDWLFDAGSGDVEVRGFAGGTLRLDTGSGTTTVSDVHGDLLDVDTGSGNVEITGAQVTRCNFDTGSGDVRATGVTAPRCLVDTGSGSVRLGYSGGTIDDLSIDTGSGGVDLTLPPNADVRVVAEMGSGGVTIVRAGGLLERRSHDRMVMRFGEGRGQIRIDTGSGGVTIR